MALESSGVGQRVAGLFSDIHKDRKVFILDQWVEGFKKRLCGDRRTADDEGSTVAKR
jgi:hypothetical protein